MGVDSRIGRGGVRSGSDCLLSAQINEMLQNTQIHDCVYIQYVSMTH